MRKQLKQLGSSERHTFQGVFKGVGFKSSYRNHYLPTLVLEQITFEGKIMTNHLWCNYTRQFSKLGVLKIGDVVQFDARIKRYTKGYKTSSKKVDYGIERPTKVVLLEETETPRLSLPDALTDKNALIGYIMMTNEAYYLATGRPYDEWYVMQFKAWRERQGNKADNDASSENG
ncbi:hypothetical protein [Lactiplantibacillus daowaiensis]|uniref:Uncharacterized protein n=1 Tax=Lactiplantibacillus daowaiensis TaxID=2559918 RepID=A0ABW1RYN6_9LACO|nr:hypothetical protein [Lactiplantibacillus daowaiensis]